MLFNLFNEIKYWIINFINVNVLLLLNFIKWMVIIFIKGLFGSSYCINILLDGGKGGDILG